MFIHQNEDRPYMLRFFECSELHGRVLFDRVKQFGFISAQFALFVRKLARASLKRPTAVSEDRLASRAFAIMIRRTSQVLIASLH